MIDKNFIIYRKKVLSAIKDSNWASEMVLNPTIIKDDKNSRIHMLFRATGAYKEKKIANKPDPFPIFLGYGYSLDDGENWLFDKENPALSPKLEYNKNNVFTFNEKGEKVVDYANGCIEDPRLFYFEEECYLTVACRMFPPGPYWENDSPMQCAPDWAQSQTNYTVNLLYRVDLDKLSSNNYKSAFTYITNLTNPRYGEDRDVVIFPNRIKRQGKYQIAILHRPFNPSQYDDISETRPSIMLSYAENFFDFATGNCERTILAVPKFSWEKDRIGASVTPIKLSDDQWLINYHGKQDEIVGYTQSFLILKENDGDFEIIKRPNERLITVFEKWEQPNRFKTPCIFITGMIKIDDELLVSYGAGDECVGVMKIAFNQLINYIQGGD